MVILYGLGSYSRDIARKYNISMEEIEIIVDNTLSLYDIYHGKVISWKEYVHHKEEYHSTQLVIGAQYRFEEIKKEVLESKLFAESEIIGIEEWAAKNFSPRLLLGEYAEKQERLNISHLSEQIGGIPQKQLEGARILCSRYEALDRMPKGGRVAEIGVAYGDFSREILTRMQPEKFYAIDLFCESVGFWDEGFFKESGTTHYEWYAGRFSDYIRSGTLVMERGFSWDVMGGFPDRYFDYIYLDAAHDYASVEKDIKQIVKKIKYGGIIQFNDYTFQENYGVVPAVNKMVKETGAKVLYYCLAPNGYADLAVQMGK